MRVRTLLLASAAVGAALGAPLAARAQPISGPYVNLGGGGNILMDEHSRASPGLNLPKERLAWQTGAVGLGSVGYGFGNGLRVEVEGNYRFNAIRQFHGTPSPTVSGGDQQEFGGMVNALFDLDIGSPYVFPYFGVGAGDAYTQWHKVYAAGTRSPFKFDDTDSFNSFAYQGIFGLSFPTPWVPGLSVTTEYRFFGVLDPQRFTGDAIAPVAGRAVERRGNFDVREDFNHSFLLGVRYAFNTAPPPPPPAQPTPVAAPPPAVNRTYLVFFDWDRADLTARARQIIAEAAQNSTRVQTTRIAVNGYTDLSGTAAYNQRLSVRRAQAVAAELVRDGVPRNEITAQGFGETNPLVPTAAGVREPQNRRVEIVLQ